MSQNDKLLMVKNDKVIGEIPLSRTQINAVEYFSLTWSQEKSAYELRLNKHGEMFYQNGKKFCVNDKVEIKPNFLYPMLSNYFVRRADAAQTGENAGTQLFIHLGDRQYLILKKLSDTVFKKSYICVDTYSNNSLVFLKLRRKDSGHFVRFRRSAMLLSSISAYIPRITDVGRDIVIDGHECDYQCFEYFKSLSLEDRLPLELNKAIKIFHQVCLAVQDLHRADLCHRNLKPEHVLIDDQNQVKLVGLTLVKKQQTQATLVLDNMLTLSGVDMSLGNGLSSPGEIIGSVEFAPFALNEKRKDIYCIASLFVYSIQKNVEQRQIFRQAVNGVKPSLTLDDLHKKYLPIDDMPASLVKILDDILINFKPVKAGELATVFATALGYVCDEVSRADQFPMPKEMKIPGAEFALWYQPLEEVGGDFYDFIPLRDGKYGILIGDTMGHGTKAYLYTQLIYPVAELFADQQIAPAPLLHKMDQLLYKSGRSRGGYAQATALYGILSLDEYCPYFMYASAGHPFPILYRPPESNDESKEAMYLRIENLPFTGTPLGMGISRFLENFLRLRESDILVFYSDGIPEITNAEGQDYGYERLRKVITAWANRAGETDTTHELVQYLKEDIQSFANGKLYLKDDITLIALRINRLGKEKQE